MITIIQPTCGTSTYRWNYENGAPTKENVERVLCGKFIRRFNERLFSAEPNTLLQNVTVTRVVVQKDAML